VAADQAAAGGAMTLVLNGSPHELPLRLQRVMVWRLVEHETRVGYPLPYGHLLRWIRLQWPRVLPEAIGKTLCELAQTGYVECDERGWKIRSPGSRMSAAREHRNGWRPQNGRAT